MTKKVTSFTLQESTFINVPGMKGKTLKQTVDRQSYPGIEMELQGPGVLCTTRAKTRFIVPAANCKVIVLADEEESKPKETKDGKGDEKNNPPPQK